MGRKLDVELCSAIGRAEDLQRAAEGFDPVDRSTSPDPRVGSAPPTPSSRRGKAVRGVTADADAHQRGLIRDSR